MSESLSENRPGSIPGRQRLSVFVGLVLLSLVVAQFIEIPSRSFDVTVFGSPLGFTLSSYWMMAILLASLICTGVDALIRTHPRVRQSPGAYTFAYWIVPGLFGLVAARLLAAAPTRPLWLAGIGLTGLLLIVILIAEYTSADPYSPAFAQARLLLNAAAYALALALFVILFQSRARSLITVTSLLLASFCLALDLVWSTRAEPRQKVILAGAVSLVLAESSWALNYWNASPWSAGILLLILFYVLTGLAVQHLSARLRPNVLAEFLFVALAGLGVLVVFHP